MDDMYVCLCADMTESEIRSAIEADKNIDTIEDLAYSTGVCSGCQTCLEVAERILNEVREAELSHLSS